MRRGSARVACGHGRASNQVTAALLALMLLASLCSCRISGQGDVAPSSQGLGSSAGELPVSSEGGLPASSPPLSSPDAPAGDWIGDYAGSTDSLSISFTASQEGISAIAGSAIVTCINSSQNAGLNQSQLFGPQQTVPLARDGSFVSTTTTTSTAGTLVVTVQGTLDGNGHASGTFRYDDADVCDTGNETWTAAIGGSTNPAPAPASSASSRPDASAGCTPAPCGTSGGVTLYVDKLGVDSGGSVATIVVYFHLRNGTPTEQMFSASSMDTYQILSGGVASAPNDSTNHGELPDGTLCNTADATLPPGASSGPLNVCIQVAPSMLTSPLTLQWSAQLNPTGVTGSIDLSGLPLTPLN